MDVSIIIVNYNTKELTAQTINSVYKMTRGISFEVILVDNASIDGSKDYFQTDNRINYIYSEENLGFGRANNLGLSVAKGRNILFLNPDTVLINNAIKILSDYIDQHNNVGACGGNLFNEDMMPTISYRRIFPGILYEFSYLFLHIPEKLFYRKTRLHNTTNKPFSVANISGADLMVKKCVLDRVGYFSPVYFMYYEETDLCFRISKARYRIMSVPTARIQHLEGKSFKSAFDPMRIRVSEKGRDNFYKQNYSRLYHKIANFIYRITLNLHYVIFMSLGNKNAAMMCKTKKDILAKLKNSQQ